MDSYRQANLESWEERVPIHAASRMYGLDRFIAEPDRLTGVVEFDAPRVGDVRGRSLLHLQCHFGLDTLSWARLGARVTGVDFSPTAIAVARRIAADIGVEARFIESELYDSPNVLNETFDVVYTSVGAINWLPDIRTWARIVADFLAPGGTFHMRESHPILSAIDDVREDHLLVLRHPYFNTGKPVRWDEPGTYTDGGENLVNNVTYEWPHSLGDVIGGLLEAGLQITAFEEHDTLEWQFLDWMVQVEGGRWALPEGRERLPMMFSVTAVKPV